MSNIELHIEELILHGFAAGDRYAIGEALERELVQLFKEQGVPPSLVQSGEISRLDAGAFEMKPGSKTEMIGQQMARAVYKGLG